MSEIVEWATESGAVRAQSCASKDEELKNEGDLWREEMCEQHPQPTKRRIQDREINGLHRIYCFPYNITVEKETFPCPDYVFELEGRKTYQIANLEHWGSLVERDVIKTIDLHLNKEILNQLKPERFEIRSLNSTALSTAYGTYFSKLQGLPKNVNLTTMQLGDWADKPMKIINSAIDSVWSYIETAGLIFGIIGAGLLLIIVAPVIEVIVVALGLFRYLGKTWFNGVQKTMTRINPRRQTTKKYWEDGYKLV